MSEFTARIMLGQYNIHSQEEYALEQFWLQWGEKAGFERKQFALMWSDASGLHSDQFVRHNFSHAQEVLWDTMCFADICEANGLEVNRKALVGAALFHDAGLHHKNAFTLDRSKEEYAALILGVSAPKYGMEAEDVEVGAQAIKSTELGVTPVSIEDKIMVRADLMNVSGDYDRDFKPVTEMLIEEALSQEELDATNLTRFRRLSIKALAGYVVHDLSLGPFDDKTWLKKYLSNLRRMVIDTAAEEDCSVKELVKELGSSAINNLFGLSRAETKKDDDRGAPKEGQV